MALILQAVCIKGGNMLMVPRLKTCQTPVQLVLVVMERSSVRGGIVHNTTAPSLYRANAASAVTVCVFVYTRTHIFL